MTSFFVICSAPGIVLESSLESCDVGSPIVNAFARHSRAKLMQLLLDGRDTPSSALLQPIALEPMEVFCSAAEGLVLLVGGETASDVRRRCEELTGRADVSELAARLGATARPSEISLDLWEELARVNNELATAHRQLAKSNAELRWINEQKNALLGMAAHDLRGPMSTVLAYAGFLLGDAHLFSNEHLAMIGRIRTSVESMLAMVDDVLDFTAIESGTVRIDDSEFPVSAVITDVVEVSRVLAAKKQITITTAIDTDTPILVADRRKLAQVLQNLVTNAIKFSYPGSQVTIAAGTTPDGFAWMAVTDRGVGMNSEETERLFQPFERVGPMGTAGEKSTGLGLAIVSRIIAAHNGTISVESARGRGSTFTVVLPPERTRATAPPS